MGYVDAPQIGPWPWRDSRGRVVPEDCVSPGLRAYAEREGLTEWHSVRLTMTLTREVLERAGVKE